MPNQEPSQESSQELSQEPIPELAYEGMSIPQLEDLMLDASEEPGNDQVFLILQELVKRGAPTKLCVECNKPIGHGLWCKKYAHMMLLSRGMR